MFWLRLSAQGVWMGYCCGCCWGAGVFEVGAEVPEPEDEPKVELPTGVVVLLAGWPMPPVLPPLMVFVSEMGS